LASLANFGPECLETCKTNPAAYLAIKERWFFDIDN
jgi:hypothetical protein